MRNRGLLGIGHQLATLPVRPLGYGARSISDFMTSAEPTVSKLGDAAVDAASPLIEGAIGSGLDAASAALMGEGAATGTGLGSAIGGPVGGVLGGVLGTGAGTAGASLAQGLKLATPVLTELAKPAIKGLGRLAYHGARDLLGAGATGLGSEDENPGMTQGRRDLAAAQNPLRISDFIQATQGAKPPDQTVMSHASQMLSPSPNFGANAVHMFPQDLPQTPRSTDATHVTPPGGGRGALDWSATANQPKIAPRATPLSAAISKVTAPPERLQFDAQVIDVPRPEMSLRDRLEAQARMRWGHR